MAQSISSNQVTKQYFKFGDWRNEVIVAGSEKSGSEDGEAHSATFGTIVGITLCPNGDLLITDDGQDGHIGGSIISPEHLFIRKLDTRGIVTKCPTIEPSDTIMSHGPFEFIARSGFNTSIAYSLGLVSGRALAFLETAKLIVDNLLDITGPQYWYHASVTPFGQLMVCGTQGVWIADPKEMYKEISLVYTRPVYKSWMDKYGGLWVLMAADSYLRLLVQKKDQQGENRYTQKYEIGLRSFREVTVTEEGRIFAFHGTNIVEIFAADGSFDIIGSIRGRFANETDNSTIAVNHTGIYFHSRTQIMKLMFEIEWEKTIYHRLFPLDKQIIKTVMLLGQNKALQGGPVHPQCSLAYLPKDLLLSIMSFLSFCIP